MEIKVTHSVPYDKGYETRCMYNDGDFWGHSVCAHHVYRDRTHGRQAPVERRLPKCALFGVWLDGEYKKCDACLEACKEALGKPMQKPLTLEEAWEKSKQVCDNVVWLEFKEENKSYLDVIPALISNTMPWPFHEKNPPTIRYFRFLLWPKNIIEINKEKYGEKHRCWATRPTDEEREAAAWES